LLNKGEQLLERHVTDLVRSVRMDIDIPVILGEILMSICDHSPRKAKPTG
jgi:hypothetical protein